MADGINFSDSDLQKLAAYMTKALSKVMSSDKDRHSFDYSSDRESDRFSKMIDRSEKKISKTVDTIIDKIKKDNNSVYEKWKAQVKSRINVEDKFEEAVRNRKEIHEDLLKYAQMEDVLNKEIRNTKAKQRKEDTAEVREKLEKNKEQLEEVRKLRREQTKSYNEQLKFEKKLFDKREEFNKKVLDNYNAIVHPPITKKFNAQEDIDNIKKNAIDFINREASFAQFTESFKSADMRLVGASILEDIVNKGTELKNKKAEIENKRSDAFDKKREAESEFKRAAKREAELRAALSEEPNKSSKTYKVMEQELNESEAFRKEKEEAFKMAEREAQTADNISKAFEALEDAINRFIGGVDSAIKDIVSHRTLTMARYQKISSGEFGKFGGTDNFNYNDFMFKVTSKLAISPFISMKKYLQNLDKAVSEGVLYNMEQRVFLASVKDSIATTFNVFDSSLMRLIRLQQKDSTAARLGMEAALTKTLNTYFEDSSYMNISSTVASTLLETEALMGKEMATEFEYNVQKWLGALYSVGMDQSTINRIATGINYLGTGNVQALAGDTATQTLFAMASSRAGLDYAEILKNGLNSSDVNSLLLEIVNYLQEISNNNNVVQSAYGDLLHVSIADLRAANSLSTDLKNVLYGSNKSYGMLKGETQLQLLQQIPQRYGLAEMMDNLMSNYEYTNASSIVENPVTYILYTVSSLLGKAGGIHLPAISVMGNMVDLSAFTIDNILKTGIFGLSSISTAMKVLNSLTHQPLLTLDSWGFEDANSSGRQIEVSSSTGLNEGTSSATYVASGSSKDIKASSIAQTTEEAAETSKITNAEMETEWTFDDFCKGIWEEKNPIYIIDSSNINAEDIYTEMFVNKTPVVASIDTSSGLGEIFELLTPDVEKGFNVNIKSSDIEIPIQLSSFAPQLRDIVRNYIKNGFIKDLSEEIRTNVIGMTGKDSNTIADMCKKIIESRLDVEIKNDKFDDYLSTHTLFG